jgi:3-oxoacyl-[acyl-carrier protein] reductase
MTENQIENPLLERIPLNRMGNTDDVAEAVEYLVFASYVTGEVLKVDGGIAM